MSNMERNGVTVLISCLTRILTAGLCVPYIDLPISLFKHRGGVANAINIKTHFE